jgi:hypothetical protein
MISYRQLEEIILTEDTSRRGSFIPLAPLSVVVALEAADPLAPAVVVDEDIECSFQSVRPVT